MQIIEILLHLFINSILNNVEYLNYYILAINIVSFTIFWIDKRKAITNKNRYSEKNLITTCLIGGGVGGALSMIIFKHKTKKWYFKLLVSISIIYLILVYVFILTK